MPAINNLDSCLMFILLFLVCYSKLEVFTTMPRLTSREEVLARLRKIVADGSIIVGADAGNALFPPC